MMRRSTVRVVIAAALVGLGWVAGQAQSAKPDFELIVNAPGGETTVECVRGCGLSWVERGVTPTAQADPTFRFECTAARCSSYKIGGWVKP